MNIAINARVLNERQGGPSRYTLNIIRELASIDKRNRYHILMYGAPDFDFSLPANFTVRVVRLRSKLFFDYVYFENFGFREFKFFDNLHHKIMIPVAARFSYVDLTVSDFTASRMRELLGIKPEKIRVIKEGVGHVFKKITDTAALSRVIQKYDLKRPFLF